MNEDFWNKFYGEDKEKISQPSSFSVFVYNKFLQDSKYSLLEIGCGNGRDTFFFSQYMDCIGTDSCQKAIAHNNNKAEALGLNRDMFRCMDVKDIFNIQLPDRMKRDNLCVYARFFLHAINDEEHEVFFSYLNSLPKGSRLAIEFRTDKDGIYLKASEKIGNISKTDHYRRFLNFEKVCHQIEALGYRIEFSLESSGLSVMPHEDPVLGRIIAEKK